MKNFKTAALLAIAALGMGAAPAMAASFVPTGTNPHNGPGSFTASGFFMNYSCTINTLNFNITSSSMTSLPGSVLTTNPGSSPCDSTSGTFDTFNVTPDSTTQINVANINFNAPFGLCSRANVKLKWTNGAVNSTVGLPAGAIAIGACTLSTLSLTAERVTIV